jgi:cytochrome c-type biogenesis protein CcmH/NrfG
MTYAVTDTISAQRAMKIAKSYIDETDDINLTDKVVVRNARTTLSLASKQLTQAHKADPQADVLIEGAVWSIPSLRSRMLIREARTWEAFNLSRAIDFATQATQADPTDAFAFHVLGIYELDAHNPKQAIYALEQAAQLEPENPEILKDLDRAKNMSGFAVAAYKAADAGALIWNILIMFWNIFAITWNVVTFPMRFLFRLLGVIK